MGLLGINPGVIMSLKLVSPTGEEHGLINEVGNSVEDNDFKNMKPDAKAKAKALRDEEHRIVKAQYLNARGPGERLTKPYCRWAGDKIQTWHFIPNYTYEVPLGLVNEVNNSPGLPQRSEVVDTNGKPTTKEGEPFRLHKFVPVGF
jgi:hypothetical protein